MKLVTLSREKEIVTSIEIESINCLQNSDLILDYKQEGFKAQKNQGVKNLSSVRYIKDQIELLAKKANKKSKNNISKRMSFEEYCSEFLDMHVSLMSDLQKKEAFNSYKN